MFVFKIFSSKNKIGAYESNDLWLNNINPPVATFYRLSATWALSLKISAIFALIKVFPRDVYRLI